MNTLVESLKAHGNVGEARAIRRDALALRLGLTVREVKAQAEAARVLGEPVLYSTDAHSGGIYLGETEQEIEQGIAKLTRFARAILRERSALKRSMRARWQAQVQKELFG